MKNIYIITSFIFLLLVSFLGITYSYEYSENSMFTFELNGEPTLNLLIGDSYVEHGVKVFLDGNDISSLVKIDNSMVDVNKVGVYKVKYEINFDGVSEYVYRIVKVTENVAPEIILKGDDIIYVDLNGSYIEPGYEIFDNYDTDLCNDIVVTHTVNVAKIGEYEIEYKVTDSSGNETKVIRKVIVR